jgi:hypothetical protein
MCILPKVSSHSVGKEYVEVHAGSAVSREKRFSEILAAVTTIDRHTCLATFIRVQPVAIHDSVDIGQH